MLVLDEGVPPGLVRIRALDHDDLLDGAVGLELASQLGLGSVEVDAGHEQGLKEEKEGGNQ